MVVYKTSGAAEGVAGFPTGGNPYKWIQIFSGTDSYNTNIIEHLITHEMGHCIGMRHTDWFSRQSCGQSGENANPVGAVHIPETPTKYFLIVNYINKLFIYIYKSPRTINLVYSDTISPNCCQPLISWFYY